MQHAVLPVHPLRLQLTPQRVHNRHLPDGLDSSIVVRTGHEVDRVEAYDANVEGTGSDGVLEPVELREVEDERLLVERVEQHSQVLARDHLEGSVPEPVLRPPPQPGDLPVGELYLDHVLRSHQRWRVRHHDFFACLHAWRLLRLLNFSHEEEALVRGARRHPNVAGQDAARVHGAEACAEPHSDLGAGRRCRRALGLDQDLLYHPTVVRVDQFLQAPSQRAPEL
mmetsp:Transcript_50996/g.159345  ORF Transcript_50996/g.159345 Transcript_50996/m.159345 type:complete len:225 (-) Transcript_50996:522-1196(-)